MLRLVLRMEWSEGDELEGNVAVLDGWSRRGSWEMGLVDGQGQFLGAHGAYVHALGLQQVIVGHAVQQPGKARAAESEPPRKRISSHCP